MGVAMATGWGMPERLQADITGATEAIERLNLLPREIERVARKTDAAVGDRARRAARKEMSEAGLSKTGQGKRVQGRGGSVWVGADDINPIYLQGRLEARNGDVYLDGALLEGARLVKTPEGGYLVQYAGGRVAGTVVVDFRGDAESAHDAAMDIALSGLYGDIFESFAVRDVTGITKRVD